MNLTTEIFTVPQDGICYFFSLMGIRRNIRNRLAIYTLQSTLRLNENKFGLVVSDIQFGTFALHSILNLTKGDHINLYFHQGIISYCNTHFTGILLTSSQKIDKIDIQSLPVHFYVQRYSSFSKIGYSSIPFELSRINLGSAIGISTGVFTASADGIYRFSFFGVNDSSNQSTWIKFRLNREMIGSAYGTDNIQFAPFYIETILELKMGDRIDVFIEQGGCFDDICLVSKSSNGGPNNI